MDYSSFASGAPSTSDQCGKTEDMLDQDQPCSLGYSNMNDLTRCFPQKKLAEFKNHPFGDNKVYKANEKVKKSLYTFIYFFFFFLFRVIVVPFLLI